MIFTTVIMATDNLKGVRLDDSLNFTSSQSESQVDNIV